MEALRRYEIFYATKGMELSAHLAADASGT